MPGELKDAVHEATRDSLRGDPDALERTLVELMGDKLAEGRAGRSLAAVLVLAELVRCGRQDISVVKAASEEALPQIDGVTPTSVRDQLLLQLAITWCPSDSRDDPVRDFDWAREHLEVLATSQGGVEACDLELSELDNPWPSAPLCVPMQQLVAGRA